MSTGIEQIPQGRRIGTAGGALRGDWPTGA